ncbi:MAG: glycoside hydrolase family 15 protein [Oligoflexia bacterium]|nr:glycoside hydrolase family 15 protein [Oligoflexia bacterium]
MKNSFKNIRDYGVIGNLVTCALIASDGSIDWLCFPYLESPSIFAALLDVKRGGHFYITPTGFYNSTQTYIKETNVLETTFFTATGTAVITDFMPLKGIDDSYPLSMLFRKVRCLSGFITMEISFSPRFNYAQDVPTFEKIKEGICCKSNNQALILHTTLPLDIIADNEAKGVFNLFAREALDQLWIAIEYQNQKIAIVDTSTKTPFTIKNFSQKNLESLLRKVIRYWRKWVESATSSESVNNNPWYDLLIRSGLTLKLLSNPDTGAIAAAATTSLPEKIGGIRNWDYRYAWLRDASFTVQAFYHLGHTQEVNDYRKWIEGIIQYTKDFSKIYIMYGMHSELDDIDIYESVLSNLSGYKDSGPVRIGNDAVKQKQHDIFGELVNVIYDTSRYGHDITDDSWIVTIRIVNHVCEIWDTPDSGIWEIRGGQRHFVYSKLMCWSAIDRGIRIAEIKNNKKNNDNRISITNKTNETIELSEIQLNKWKEVKKEIENVILTQGFSKKMNSFTQVLDSDILDSSLLLIPILGFLPVEDERVQGTINAIIEHLSAGKGLIYRYLNDDGLAGDEGCFLLCTFWLIEALTLSERIEEAEKYFLEMLNYLSPLGLYSEEVDPLTGEQLGNFPQAFSHIGLINSALYLGIAKGKKHKGPEPIGIDEQHKI